MNKHSDVHSKVKKQYSINSWLIAAMAGLIYSSLHFVLINLLNPAGNRWDLPNLFFAFGSAGLSLACLYVSYRFCLHFFKDMRLSRRYVSMLFLSLPIFCVLYLGYWVILIRKMVYGLSTDISSYAGQLFYVVTSLHFVMAIIVISSLYNAHVHKIELQLSHAQSLATETRLKNLQQQVDPHFLFNSLNILTALIPLDPEKAISFTQRLGEMYRFVLRSQEEDLVPLSQELQFAQDYYYLLSCRYQHSLFLHVDNQSQLHMHDLFIMPFTLQLLIENAVKHNVGEADRPLHMTIRIRNQSIVVENNLQFKHGNQGHGFGLRNLQERYRLLSQQAVRVQKEKDQFSVEVPLMKRLKTSA